jgi:hypothetical protein
MRGFPCTILEIRPKFYPSPVSLIREFGSRCITLLVRTDLTGIHTKTWSRKRRSGTHQGNSLASLGCQIPFLFSQLQRFMANRPKQWLLAATIMRIRRFVHDRNRHEHRYVPITAGDPQTRYSFIIERFGTHRSQTVFGISGGIVARRDLRCE